MSKNLVFPNVGFASPVKKHVQFGELPWELRYHILQNMEPVAEPQRPRYPLQLIKGVSHDHTSMYALCTNEFGGVEMYECTNQAQIDVILSREKHRQYDRVQWLTMHHHVFETNWRRAIEIHRNSKRKGNRA